MPTILGISCGHDGSVSLCREGRLVAHVATERLTRKKKARGIVPEALRYVLQKAELEISEVDCVAVSNWLSDRDIRGRQLWDGFRSGFKLCYSDGCEYGVHEDSVFQQMFWEDIQGDLQFSFERTSLPAYVVKHHYAHAAASFFLSPFREALAFTLDFSDHCGNNHSLYHFSRSLPRGVRITGGDRLTACALYAMVCDYLGFYPSLTSAGKVMALAAFGQPHECYQKYCYPEDYVHHNLFGKESLFALLSELGIKELPAVQLFYPQLPGEGGYVDPAWRLKKDAFSEISVQLAATVQLILESSVENYLTEVKSRFGYLTENLCLGGGAFLNSVMNGKLWKREIFSHLFAAPPCGDDGLSIGAALAVEQLVSYRQSSSSSVVHSIRDCISGGIEYSDQQIADAVDAADLGSCSVIVYPEEEMLEVVADALESGAIIGWFQGGSEIGPRALGNRSILADPRSLEMKDALNLKVKHRESFRPFGPVVLQEYAKEWFDLSESPFMLQTAQCLQAARIPAGVHSDGSSRLQTISEDINPRYYHLIRAFFERTGVPVLLNTSFNVNGEPIVESPSDALSCFLNTKIDILVIHTTVIRKSSYSSNQAVSTIAS